MPRQGGPLCGVHLSDALPLATTGTLLSLLLGAALLGVRCAPSLAWLSSVTLPQ